MNWLDRTLENRIALDLSPASWLWFIVGIVTILLLGLLYRAERRLVTRRVGLVLTAFRIAAAGSLTLAFLEPVAIRSWREEITGRVVVAVDVSGSMETEDNRRDPAEVELLQQAPGLDPRQSGRLETRLETVARILRGPGFQGLRDNQPVELLSFAHRMTTVEVSQFLEALKEDQLERLGIRTEDRDETNWNPVFQSISATSETEPITAVILLSDGRHNAIEPSSITNLVQETNGTLRTIPIYPVLMGSTAPPRDVAIAEIQAPPSAFPGDTIAVSVEVAVSGLEQGTKIPVTLENSNGVTLQELATVESDEGRIFVPFRLPISEEGNQHFTATVDPKESTSDARVENNKRSFDLRVQEDPIRVLLVDLEARWEFQFIRNALRRDSQVDLSEVLLEPPNSNVSTRPTFATSLPPPPEPGSNQSDPISEFNVIILGDVPPEKLSDSLLERLELFVADQGGTLVILTGPRSWPDRWRDHRLMQELLPVSDLELSTIDPSAIDPNRLSLPAGVQLVPTLSASEEMNQWPMLQFATNPSASRLAWSRLAPMPWALVGAAKPGATPLLVVASPEPNAPDADNRATVATQPFGLGNVFWVGTDSTWRWRLRVGDPYHHRFWGQVVRWGTVEEPSGGNDLVRFGPLQAQTVEGEAIALQAQFGPEVTGVTSDLLTAVRVYPEKSADSAEASPLALVRLRPVPGRLRDFEGTVSDLLPGRYRAVLEAPELDDFFDSEELPPVEATFEVTSPENGELIELSARADLLEQLANVTGGVLLRDYEAGRLAELIRPITIDRERSERRTLWDQPFFLLLFFSLLTVEWIIRKRAELP